MHSVKRKNEKTFDNTDKLGYNMLLYGKVLPNLQVREEWHDGLVDIHHG